LPTYSYLNLGDDIPPAPIFPIVVTPPDWAESIKQYQMGLVVLSFKGCPVISILWLAMLQLRLLEPMAVVGMVYNSEF
jgi:hypothetical protein